jgi:hypothetical protein
MGFLQGSSCCIHTAWHAGQLPQNDAMYLMQLAHLVKEQHSQHVPSIIVQRHCRSYINTEDRVAEVGSWDGSGGAET